MVRIQGVHGDGEGSVDRIRSTMCPDASAYCSILVYKRETHPTAFLFLIESGCLDDKTGPRSSADGAPHTSGIGFIPT